MDKKSHAAYLPVGAVQTDEGEVIVPPTKRADGSMRKTIRIRKGYVPQEEVPKYKTVAQRRREAQGMKKESSEILTTSFENISLQTSPIHKIESKEKMEYKYQTKKEAMDQSKSRAMQLNDNATSDQKTMRERLATINKLLKEMEVNEKEPQYIKHKMKEQKSALQHERTQLIATLSGAEISQSNNTNQQRKSKSSKTRCVINL